MKVYVTVMAGHVLSSSIYTYNDVTIKGIMDVVNLWKDSLMEECSRKGATVRPLVVDRMYYMEADEPLPVKMMVYISLEG